MTHCSPRSNPFILEAFDCDLWCPVAQTLFHVIGVAFDRSQLESADLIIRLLRRRRLSGAPYLIHTGYELPLLLDGRKKLPRMSDAYPPMTFDGEDRFDHWVAKGLLYREEVLEPFDSPVKGYLGLRTVYYTLKGEEWRIPASKLIWEASSRAGGWNEYFERLKGMLYGYDNWQNDWWIDIGLRGGGFGRAALARIYRGEFSHSLGHQEDSPTA